MENVKASKTYTDWRGTEIHTVRLWCADTATEHGHHAGSACYQFPLDVYGDRAVELAEGLLKYASRLANNGISIDDMRRMIKDRLNEREISYDGSCSGGIL